MNLVVARKIEKLDELIASGKKLMEKQGPKAQLVEDTVRELEARREKLVKIAETGEFV